MEYNNLCTNKMQSNHGVYKMTVIIVPLLPLIGFVENERMRIGMRLKEKMNRKKKDLFLVLYLVPVPL